MLNSFDSLTELGEGNSWALTFVNGSPPPLQVDVTSLLGMPFMGFCCLLETRVREGNFGSISSRSNDSWGYSCSYSSSGVGHIWVMWKRGRFNFNHRVVDEQFISSSLTDLLSGLVWRHFVFMPLIEFDIAIREADLIEPSIKGNWFTWTSKVHKSGLLCCFDHILVNEDWLSIWPSSRVNVLPWGISNHSPILFYPGFQQSR
ncbi:uncharacterized protein E6C27_scaffold355G00730 [Cucumis melo var. makuwa]|uniref:Uncharacterized protein n=1 Tax=Cucumis melo var. makuwa TaxID=1194695 RepID=A0A5A7U9M6_CUCMM|nr:uncharacterized protein E6C27_scaffold355G00730 [Cucumis melo var. makuwa]